MVMAITDHIKVSTLFLLLFVDCYCCDGEHGGVDSIVDQIKVSSFVFAFICGLLLLRWIA